jgi:transposase-like protein
MPWKETCPMEERKRFIEDWLAGGNENVAGLCRVYAISRKTGYKWLERFREGGMRALEDRSHAAHRQPRRIVEELERRLIEARRRPLSAPYTVTYPSGLMCYLSARSFRGQRPFSSSGGGRLWAGRSSSAALAG